MDGKPHGGGDRPPEKNLGPDTIGAAPGPLEPLHRNGIAKPPLRYSADSRSAVIALEVEAAAVARRQRRAAPFMPHDPTKAAELERMFRADPGVSSESQRRRMLEALAAWPCSSFELRRHLGIYWPAGRVAELRRAGHEVLLSWVRVVDDVAQEHRVGLYTLSRLAGSSTAAAQAPAPREPELAARAEATVTA